jgi:prepilin-type N-terminal cleavage/methylation domain-containing protein
MGKNNHKRQSTTQQGFTLLEVMVVTAIVGVMAAIAIPSYLSWKPGHEFRGAVSRINSDLNKAKMRALETRKESRVMFCGDEFYQIIDGNQALNSNWNVPGTTNPPACPMTTAQRTAFEGDGRRVQIRSVSDYNQVTITTSPAPIFSPRGLTSSLGTISVNHPKTNGADISVNISGRVRVDWK